MLKITQLKSKQSPDGRTGFGLCYDDDNFNIYIFGGCGSSNKSKYPSCYADLWYFSGIYLNWYN